MCHLPSKRDALQAHMHKVHKLGNAHTDTNYYTYFQNLIKNKSALSKISNASSRKFLVLQGKRDSD